METLSKKQKQNIISDAYHDFYKGGTHYGICRYLSKALDRKRYRLLSSLAFPSPFDHVVYFIPEIGLLKPDYNANREALWYNIFDKESRLTALAFLYHIVE